MKTVLLAAALAASAGTVHGQVFDWSNAAGGVWETPGNWSPLGPPSAVGDTARFPDLGSYVVTIGASSPSIDSLELVGSGAVVGIAAPRFLTLNGPLALENEGTVVVNSGGSSSTAFLIMGADTAFAGSGAVLLNGTIAENDAQLSIPGGLTLTNGSMHTIAGAGQILGSLVNEGLVSANLDQERLQFTSGSAVTNTGELRAESGGELWLQNTAVNNVGGVIRPLPLSVIRLSGSTVNGGTMGPSGSDAVFLIENSSLDGVEVSSRVDVPGVFSMTVGSSGIENNGTVTINSNGSSSASFLQVPASATIGGSGTIRLRGLVATNDAQVVVGANQLLTIGPMQSFVGAGEIRGDFLNLGEVNANIVAETLEVTGNSDVDNDGLIGSANGGTIRFSSTAVDNSGGEIRVLNGSFGQLSNATIEGGVMDSAGTGVFDVRNSALGGLVSTARLEIPGAFLVEMLAPGLTNDGEIVINSNGSASSATFDVRSDATLGGTGTMFLNGTIASSDARVSVSAGEVFTHGSGHTIRGAGNFIGEVINRGEIIADLAGEEMLISGASAFTNEGLLRAESGGEFELSSRPVDNGLGAIEVGDGSDLVLTNTTITGGTIDGFGSGLVTATSSTLDGVDMDARLEIPGAFQLTIGPGGLVSDGELIVNSNFSASSSTLRIAAGPGVTGSGEIALRGTVAFNDAIITGQPAGANYAIGAGTTVRGAGQIDGPFVIDAVVSADLPSETLVINGGDPSVNNGGFGVEDGSTLRVQNATLVNNGGIVLADGGTVQIASTRVEGGLIQGPAGALVELSAATLAGVELAANAQVDVAQTVTIAASPGRASDLDLTGRLVVNPARSSTTSTLTSENVDLMISGGGEIVLNGLVTSDALFIGPAGVDTRLSISDATISGIAGQLREEMDLGGALEPGTDTEAGEIEIAFADVVIGPTASVGFDLFGSASSEFDRLDLVNPSDSLAVGGAFDARARGGFDPAVGASFEVIEPGGDLSGCFANDIASSTTPSGNTFRIAVNDDNAVVFVIAPVCDLPGDADRDGIVGLNDLLAVLSSFGSDDACRNRGDLDGDRLVGLDDLLAVLGEFGQSCP